jgi:IPT/TIG domain
MTRVPTITAALAGLLLLAACREEAPPEIPAGRLVRKEGGSARSLLALVPEQCRAGEVFRPRPNGDAELVVAGTGLTRSDAVLWNGRPLKTDFASSRALSVTVPPALLEAPGTVEVTVEDTFDRERPKLRATFVVRPRA